MSSRHLGLLGLLWRLSSPGLVEHAEHRVESAGSWQVRNLFSNQNSTLRPCKSALELNAVRIKLNAAGTGTAYNAPRRIGPPRIISSVVSYEFVSDVSSPSSHVPTCSVTGQSADLAVGGGLSSESIGNAREEPARAVAAAASGLAGRAAKRGEHPRHDNACHVSLSLVYSMLSCLSL